jgi:HupE/UreJ protein
LTRPLTESSLRPYLWTIAFLALLALPRWAVANGADLPPQIVLQGFVKPEAGRLHLLVRVPLVLLSSFSLPKRGLGYLDLARIDDRLKQAATATGHQIELFADGIALTPTAREARISLPSDHSFSSYSTALAHLQGPPLPIDTDLFWNQGFFDTQLEYPLQSPRPNLWIRVNVAPELGRRVKLRLEYLAVDGPPLTYELPGVSGWIALDPRWYEAAWLFVKGGFFDAFAFDRFVFLLCLVAPFRQFRSLLAVVMVLTGLQALTSTAIVEGTVVDSPLLAALFSTSLAAAIVLLAIGNLAAPSLRRRWFISAIVGAVGGFGLGHLLADALQFAGAHSLVSVVSFNVGVALGEVVSLALALAALRLLFARMLGPALGVVVLSAVLGHMGWHWMGDGGHELVHELGHVGLSSALVVVAPWLLPALLVGGIAYFLPRRFGGVPIPSLLPALLGNGPGAHRN